jgi:hypothetical protein
MSWDARADTPEQGEKQGAFQAARAGGQNETRLRTQEQGSMMLAKFTLDYVPGNGKTLRSLLLTGEADRVQWLVARPDGVAQHALLGHMRDLQEIALAEGFAQAVVRHDMDRARAHHDALILLLALRLHQAHASLCFPKDGEEAARAEAHRFRVALASQRAMNNALFPQPSSSAPLNYLDAMAALASS